MDGLHVSGVASVVRVFGSDTDIRTFFFFLSFSFVETLDSRFRKDFYILLCFFGYAELFKCVLFLFVIFDVWSFFVKSSFIENLESYICCVMRFLNLFYFIWRSYFLLRMLTCSAEFMFYFRQMLKMGFPKKNLHEYSRKVFLVHREEITLRVVRRIWRE